MKHTATVTISRQEAAEMKKILRTKGRAENDIILTKTIKFGHAGYEADIKVCNTDDKDSTPYVDAVLFQNGNEVTCLEPSFETLDGEYHFYLPGHELVGTIAIR